MDRPQFLQVWSAPGGGTGGGAIIIAGADGTSLMIAPATDKTIPTRKSATIPKAKVRYVDAEDRSAAHHPGYGSPGPLGVQVNACVVSRLDAMNQP